MRSRLTSHRAEASPTLFHSGLGSVDPVAVRLEITGWTQDDGDYDDLIANLSALLHERHHWLQHVGTSAGLFNTLLLALQASTLERGVPLARLRPDDLPLLQHEDRFAQPLLLWERLEATRRLHAGCRPADYSVLADNGRHALRRDLVPLADEVMGSMLPTPAAMDAFRAIRDSPDLRLDPPPMAVKEAGWSLGSRHLMEGAARLSEVIRLLAGELDRDDREPGVPIVFDVGRHFTGIYGVAHRMFQQLIPTATAAAEIGFAFACDVALNCLAAPLYPFPPYTPGIYFTHVVNSLKTFRFDRSIDFVDPGQVRSLIEEMTAHLPPDLMFPMTYKRDMTTHFLGSLTPENTASRLFTLRETGGVPDPAPGGRLRYELALATKAERLRAGSPEAFVFPAASYIHDRAKFRSLFNQVAPPLVSYGASGISPSDPRPGWLEYFLATGVHGEVLRGAVMFDATTLGARLTPYLRSAGGPDHGEAVIRTVLRGVFHHSLADEIWQHTVSAA